MAAPCPPGGRVMRLRRYRRTGVVFARLNLVHRVQRDDLIAVMAYWYETHQDDLPRINRSLVEKQVRERLHSHGTHGLMLDPADATEASVEWATATVDRLFPDMEGSHGRF